MSQTTLGLYRPSGFQSVLRRGWNLFWEPILGADHRHLLSSDHALALEYLPYLFEFRTYLARRESYLSESLDIGELRTAVLKEYNGFKEAKAALEQSDFVNNILASMKRLIRVFVLSGHD